MPSRAARTLLHVFCLRHTPCRQQFFCAKHCLILCYPRCSHVDHCVLGATGDCLPVFVEYLRNMSENIIRGGVPNLSHFACAGIRSTLTSASEFTRALMNAKCQRPTAWRAYHSGSTHPVDFCTAVPSDVVDDPRSLVKATPPPIHDPPRCNLEPKRRPRDIPFFVDCMFHPERGRAGLRDIIRLPSFIVQRSSRHVK